MTPSTTRYAMYVSRCLPLCLGLAISLPSVSHSCGRLLAYLSLAALFRAPISHRVFSARRRGGAEIFDDLLRSEEARRMSTVPMAAVTTGGLRLTDGGRGRVLTRLSVCGSGLLRRPQDSRLGIAIHAACGSRRRRALPMHLESAPPPVDPHLAPLRLLLVPLLFAWPRC